MVPLRLTIAPKAHHGALEAHHSTMEAHRDTMETHYGAGKRHHGAVEIHHGAVEARHSGNQAITVDFPSQELLSQNIRQISSAATTNLSQCLKMTK